MCLLLCTITFPIYFASANTEFVTGAVAFNDVTAHVKPWSQWPWGRTGLALLAVVFAAWDFVQVEQPQAELVS